MPIVSVIQLGKSFGAERIFSGINFQIEEHDSIGLVGPNGAGKSTLLNILAGREEPDEGSIAVARNTRIGYLTQVVDFHPEHTLREEMLTVFAELHGWEQELSKLAADMSTSAALGDAALHEQLLARYDDLQTRYEHAGGYTYENRVEQVLDGLGFTREQQAAPVMHLSGGQQTRASLGKLLLQEPDLLLLDEPTNHLDLAALEWLETYLTTWKGALVIVAHDRYFLDKVASRTLELAFGRIEEYPGNYTKYLHLREERMERRQREYEAQRAHIAHTEEFIRRYKAGQRSREARGRQKLLDRLERIERPQDFPELHFEFTPVTDSGLVVLATHKLAAGYGSRTKREGERDGAANVLVRVADLELLRGDRVGLIGPNGAGKTTLLRTLIGELPPISGQVQSGHNVRIGYYSQTHAGLNMERTIVDEIRQVSVLSEEGARSFLGRFLFSGDDVFKPIGALSGGERSRVALAKLTLQGSNFMVLDEPTNHLDLQSRQFLEEVLSEFEGTLLFVSHDRYFIDSLATKVWVIEDGVLIPYLGNYTDYRTRKQAIVLDVPAPVSKATKSQLETKAVLPASPAKSNGKKGSKVKARTVEDVERDVEKAEARVKSVEEALAQAALNADAAQLTQLSADYEQAKARVDELLAEWERLLRCA